MGCTQPGATVTAPLGVMLHWECAARPLQKTGALSRSWTHFRDKDRKGATLCPSFRCPKIAFYCSSGMDWGELPPPPQNVSFQGARKDVRERAPHRVRVFLPDRVTAWGQRGWQQRPDHCESFCSPGRGGDLGDIKCFAPPVSP